LRSISISPSRVSGPHSGRTTRSLEGRVNGDDGEVAGRAGHVTSPWLLAESRGCPATPSPSRNRVAFSILRPAELPHPSCIAPYSGFRFRGRPASRTRQRTHAPLSFPVCAPNRLRLAMEWPPAHAASRSSAGDQPPTRPGVAARREPPPRPLDGPSRPGSVDRPGSSFALLSP